MAQENYTTPPDPRSRAKTESVFGFRCQFRHPPAVLIRGEDFRRGIESVLSRLRADLDSERTDLAAPDTEPDGLGSRDPMTPSKP